ncbi:hypothetical protein BpHYR1_018672 [Brachionus plicatilis]|uniref:Uncharacterized protein n=1 Tax=Brachionus plicatilis TaxID=10195 RepID=A0A3M7T5A1_BRAPC|nr:hypothetical protein BpHYR1_018672 [Brachionus plicatilis]
MFQQLRQLVIRIVQQLAGSCFKRDFLGPDAVFSFNLLSANLLTSSSLLSFCRLNFGGTKFVSADTFCRKIFRSKILSVVLLSKIHNA